MHWDQCFSTGRAQMQHKQWRILDFKIRADQTLETFYFNLCNFLAWGHIYLCKITYSTMGATEFVFYLYLRLSSYGRIDSIAILIISWQWLVWKWNLATVCFQDLRFRKLINFVNFSCFHGNMTILKWPCFYFFSQIFQISFGKYFLIFCKHDFNILQRRITFS